MKEVFAFESSKSSRAVAAGGSAPGFLDSASRGGGHARRLGHKIAATSKELLVSAMTKIGEGSSRLWRTGLPPLPPGLHERPEGVVEVALPSSETERLERLRDLGRTMQGGSILVLGRRRLYPVRPQHQSIGQVSTASCEAALDALAESICQELLDEGYGLNEKGVAYALLHRRGTLGVPSDFDETPDPEYLKRHKIDEKALRSLAAECAVNISVSPGMQLVAECGLDPVLYQPTFVVCIGGGQLRVLTFAFVGGPVSGDRPDRKRTPFAIRLATDDLVALSRVEASDKVSKLRYAAHAVDPAVQTSLDMIVILEEELFHANEAGDWQKLAAVGTAEPTIETEMEASVSEKGVVAESNDAQKAADKRLRMESESWVVHTDLGEGYAGPLAHAPAASAQHPGLPSPPSSRRFSWLLRRLGAKEDHVDSVGGPFESVPGTGGL
ncbi:unnamed protein product [Symbiodinium pilosum]|uniref:Uncharacterized protein n=1 Tax=Symbiodinium pilosum TaxID=2952 RepID=A0A812W420_SYMPI|nr:unnamed protein product [Symbiodinium pilosum]